MCQSKHCDYYNRIMDIKTRLNLAIFGMRRERQREGETERQREREREREDENLQSISECSNTPTRKRKKS